MKQERIRFSVQGDTLIGDLYLPSVNGPHPALIIGGPMTSVKEQVTGVYARAFAQRGFAALAIDHRHYGESGGEPRQYKCYAHKIEDLKAGIEALESHAEIDANKIAAVGVCLGTGYIMWASTDNPKVKAVGGIAGYYRDVEEMRTRDPVGFQSRASPSLFAGANERASSGRQQELRSLL